MAKIGPHVAKGLSQFVHQGSVTQASSMRKFAFERWLSKYSQSAGWLENHVNNERWMQPKIRLEILRNARVALLIRTASLLNACVPSSAHVADYGHIRASTSIRAIAVGTCLAMGSSGPEPSECAPFE
jgi:hypothetical protein